MKVKIKGNTEVINSWRVTTNHFMTSLIALHWNSSEGTVRANIRNLVESDKMSDVAAYVIIGNDREPKVVS